LKNQSPFGLFAERLIFRDRTPLTERKEVPLGNCTECSESFLDPGYCLPFGLIRFSNVQIDDLPNFAFQGFFLCLIAIPASYKGI
jgi:hypothetical protein